MYKAGALYILKTLSICILLCSCSLVVKKRNKTSSSSAVAAATATPTPAIQVLQLTKSAVTSSSNVLNSFIGNHLKYSRIGCGAHEGADGKLYFLGGFQGTGATFFAPAEYYDPSASGSSIFGTYGTPSANRAYHSTTSLSDGRVILIGGNTDGQNSLNSVEIFDPSQSPASAWTRVDPIPTARENHAAIQLSDGRVVVIGGITLNATVPTNSLPTQIFNPSAASGSQWSSADVDPATPHDSAMTLYLLSSDRVLVLDNNYGATIFNPNAASGSQWSIPDQPPYGHGNGSSIRLLNGKIAWIGGYDNISGGSGQVTGRVDVFDPNASSGSQWSTLDTSPQVRQEFRLALLPDGKVLVVGGRDENGNSLNSIQLLNPNASSGSQWSNFGVTQNSWTEPFQVTMLSTGKVIVSCTAAQALLEEIDVSGNHVNVIGQLKSPALFASIDAKLSDGRVVFIGGTNNVSVSTNAVNIFDPLASAGNEWSTLDSIVGARNTIGTLGKGVVLPDDRVVILGGFDGGGTSYTLNNSILNPNSTTGNQWTVLDPLPNSAAGFGYAQLGTSGHKLLACGGLTQAGPTLVDNCYEINVNAASGSQITATDAISTPLFISTLLTLPDGRVLRLGGVDAVAPSLHAVNSVQIYNPASASGSRWTALDSMPVALIMQSLQVLPNGKVLVVGGSPDMNTWSTNAYMFDPNASTGSQWQVVDSKPSTASFYGSTPTLLLDGRVLFPPEIDTGGNFVTYIFNPSASTGNQWSSIAINSGGMMSTANTLNDGSVLISGGIGLAGLSGDYSIFYPSGQQSTISVTGGTAPYTYQILSGAGSVNNSGVVSSGTSGDITVRVTDAANNTEDILISF